MRFHWYTGQVAWVLHRVSGLAIVVYLILHIYSISKLSDPATFNAEMDLYSQPIFKLGEVALLAARIHDVAKERGQDVRLIGVPSEGMPEVELRRQLALVAAFIRDAGTKVETRMEHGPDWMTGLQFRLSEQDTLACCVGNPLPVGRRPLTDVLASHFEGPVYAFEDSGQPAYPRTNLLTRLMPWLGSIAVILGFLWLQIRASQYLSSGASTAVLLLSVPVEIALIWLCNSLVG